MCLFTLSFPFTFLLFNLFTFVLFCYPFDDAKVRTIINMTIVPWVFYDKNGLVFDLHQNRVPAHKSRSI